MLRLLFVLIFMQAPLLILAQKESKENAEQKSIALIGLNFGIEKNIEILNNIKDVNIRNPYFRLPIDSVILSAHGQGHRNYSREKRKEKVFNDLFNKNRIGQQILSYWFNLQNETSLNTDKLNERNSADFSIADYLEVASSGKERYKLNEMGLTPVNQTYIMVLDFENTKTMKEYYREIGTKKKFQYLNGYISDVNCYLFKFDFNASVASEFFNDFRINAGVSNKTSNNKKFDDAGFPFIYVKSYNQKISSVQHIEGHPLAPRSQKSNNQLLQNLTELALENVLTDLETKKIPYRLRLAVAGADPVSANIGLTDGLKFDQSFTVIENRVGKKGKIKKKKAGIVKCNKLIDAGYDSIPQYVHSAFYQISGSEINKGMYLQKRNDVGLNIVLGKSVSGMESYNARLEYYLSKTFTDAVATGKTIKGATSIKVYLASAYHQKLYNINDHIWNNTFVRGSIGISKDFYPFRFLHWGPFLGYGLETVTREGTPNVVSSSFAEFGLRLGLNIIHNAQFILSYNFYKFFKSVEMDENRDVVNSNFNYDGVYNDRDKMGISVGIRYMF